MASPVFPDMLPPSLACSLEDGGEIAVVRLNRPDKRNALDTTLIAGIERLFAAPLPGVKAVVLAGAGPHFSAGLDLSDLAERTAPEGLAHSLAWHRAFERIQFGAVPVVAVLHGAVVGGGLELACASHIRVAERSAFYGLPEGQRGVFVGGGGAARLPRLIGVARMMDMILTGRVLDAEEGQRVGLSHYLVEPDAGLAQGLALARRIAANSALSNFAILQALPRIADVGQDPGLLMEALAAAVVQSDDEAKSRIKAFLAGTAPKVERTPS